MDIDLRPQWLDTKSRGPRTTARRTKPRKSWVGSRHELGETDKGALDLIHFAASSKAKWARGEVHSNDVVWTLPDDGEEAPLYEGGPLEEERANPEMYVRIGGWRYRRVSLDPQEMSQAKEE